MSYDYEGWGPRGLAPTPPTVAVYNVQGALDSPRGGGSRRGGGGERFAVLLALAVLGGGVGATIGGARAENRSPRAATETSTDTETGQETCIPTAMTMEGVALQACIARGGVVASATGARAGVELQPVSEVAPDSRAARLTFLEAMSGLRDNSPATCTSELGRVEQLARNVAMQEGVSMLPTTPVVLFDVKDPTAEAVSCAIASPVT